MSGQINWGILGTGKIARKFAAALAHSRTGRLVAVGSRSAARAAEFAQAFPGVRAHGSYAALVADSGVTAVYVATPHSEHHDGTLLALGAGRAVLCEKPLALTGHESAQMVAAARDAGLFLMEAMMYRCHPQTDALAAALHGGAIGELRAIEATFCDRFPFVREHRAYNAALGGGGILDLGCYPVSFARRMAGAACGRSFAEPVRFAGVGRRHAIAGVDEYAAAVAVFPGGIIAQLACGFCARSEAGAKLFGTEGWIEVPEPFLPGVGGGSARFILHRHDGAASREVTVPAETGLYALEADAVGAALAAGELESPAMTLSDTLGNARVLDAWRAHAGVAYDAEFPAPAFLNL